MKTEGITYALVTLVLRIGLVVALFSAGWFIYTKLPASQAGNGRNAAGQSSLQIVLEVPSDPNANPLDIPVELYPVDIVAVHHEFFTERRAGKRFDDFLNERMNGRTPVTTRLDKQGQASLLLPPGNWWIHAVLSGDEDLEWRLEINVGGQTQRVELTPQNAYTRAKSF